MNKVVITVLGVDRVGIIAAVTQVLAARSVNVLSINQTILDGFFNMVLMGDLGDTAADVSELKAALSALGNEMGLEINTQRADVFYRMHRV